MKAIVTSPPPPQGGGSSTGGLWTSAGSQQSLGSSYITWSLLPLNKQEQQDGHHTQLAFLPGSVPANQAGQCPRCHKYLLGSKKPPKLPSTQNPHRGLFYMGPLSVQQTREKLYKGAYRQLQRFFGIRVTSKHWSPPSLYGGQGLHPGSLTWLQALSA